MRKNMKRYKSTVVLSVLLILNSIAICFLAAKVTKLSHFSLDEATVHYTLYVGTNDKDTYKQEIPTERARQVVEEICTKYIGGFTVQDATGIWTDEKGVITHENTIVCYLDDIDEETLHRVCDEIRSALNQNTVLIQKEYTQLDFYSGMAEKE